VYACLQSLFNSKSSYLEEENGCHTAKRTKVFRDDTACVQQAVDRGFLSRHSSEPDVQSLNAKAKASRERFISEDNRVDRPSCSMTGGENRKDDRHQQFVSEDDQVSLSTPPYPNSRQYGAEEEVHTTDSVGKHTYERKCQNMAAGYPPLSGKGQDSRGWRMSNRSSWRSSSGNFQQDMPMQGNREFDARDMDHEDHFCHSERQPAQRHSAYGPMQQPDLYGNNCPRYPYSSQFPMNVGMPNTGPNFMGNVGMPTMSGGGMPMYGGMNMYTPNYGQQTPPGHFTPRHDPCNMNGSSQKWNRPMPNMVMRNPVPEGPNQAYHPTPCMPNPAMMNCQGSPNMFPRPMPSNKTPMPGRVVPQFQGRPSPSQSGIAKPTFQTTQPGSGPVRFAQQPDCNVTDAAEVSKGKSPQDRQETTFSPDSANVDPKRVNCASPAALGQEAEAQNGTQDDQLSLNSILDKTKGISDLHDFDISVEDLDAVLASFDSPDLEIR